MTGIHVPPLAVGNVRSGQPQGGEAVTFIGALDAIATSSPVAAGRIVRSVPVASLLPAARIRLPGHPVPAGLIPAAAVLLMLVDAVWRRRRDG